MAYNSKYTGAEVEARLDKVDEIPKMASDLEDVTSDVGELNKTVKTLSDRVTELGSNEIDWIEVE